MCIAIVKPTGVQLPARDVLKTCWSNNPDGAGFCFNDGQKVVIQKGFMSFNKFYKAFEKCAKNNDLLNKDVAIHFRISTSGGVKPQNTHPFVISQNINDLTKTFSKCESAFIHNGIISGYGTKDYSDTMEYVTHVVSNIHDIKNSGALINSLANEKHSRFAVVTPTNYLLGGDWVKDNGIFYSNTTYKPYVYKTYTQSKAYTQSSFLNTPQKCDFCWQPFKCKDLHYTYDKNSREFYRLCDDCYKFYNGIDNYNKLDDFED